MNITAPSFVRSPEDSNPDAFVSLNSLRGDRKRSEAAITNELQAAQPIIDRAFHCALALEVDAVTFHRLLKKMLKTYGGTWENDCVREEKQMDESRTSPNHHKNQL